MEGKRKFKWEEHIYYKKKKKNNMRNGKGVYHFGDKNKIEGNWKNNLPHGEGIITYNNQKVEGEFRYGKLIKGQNIKEDKNKKNKSSSEDKKHKSHKHHHDKDKNKSKSKEKNKKNKDEGKDSNNNKDNSPVEIDGIPGICVKKMK